MHQGQLSWNCHADIAVEIVNIVLKLFVLAHIKNSVICWHWSWIIFGWLLHTSPTDNMGYCFSKFDASCSVNFYILQQSLYKLLSFQDLYWISSFLSVKYWRTGDVVNIAMSMAAGILVATTLVQDQFRYPYIYQSPFHNPLKYYLCFCSCFSELRDEVYCYCTSMGLVIQELGLQLYA